MKSGKIIQSFIILLLFCVGYLAGCGKEQNQGEVQKDTKKVALVIIAGRHANAKMYSEEMIGRAGEYIEGSYNFERDSSGKYAILPRLSVIVCDGNPEKVSLELDENKYMSANSADMRGKTGDFVLDVTEFLLSPSLKADDEEVDLLLALSRAQDILDDYPDCEHHIVVLDTGITTAGYLDMNKMDILSSSCEDVIEKIRQGIPHFNGTEVTFLGLGNVAFPQSSIINAEGKEKIEELWAGIIEAGGGILTPDCLNYNDTEDSEAMVFSEDGGDDVYKFVSAVSFYNAASESVEPNPVVIKHEEKSEEPTVTFCFQTADLGGFVKNTAEFCNIDVAVSTLNKMSGDLNTFINRTDRKLYIVGSIAKTSPDKDAAASTVSKDRAQAVADLLVNRYSVPDDRIEIIDAGTTPFSWRNADEFPDGTAASYDMAAAQKNRVVAIISENSSLADELKPEYIKE